MVKRKPATAKARPGMGATERKRIRSALRYKDRHGSSSSTATGDNFQLEGSIPKILTPESEEDCHFSVDYASNCRKEHAKLLEEEALGFPGRAQTFKVMVACRFSLLCKKMMGYDSKYDEKRAEECLKICGKIYFGSIPK